MVLISASMPKLLRHRTTPFLGRLFTPRYFSSMNSLRQTVEMGIPWAADNDCFVGFDQKRWMDFTHRLVGLPGCLFATAPDVVADAEATLERFDTWEPYMHDLGLPVALVAQDGLTPQTTPWDRLEAIFIGGSTEWKLGAEAREIVAEAKARGKWTHMGRVNTVRRAEYAQRIGCDSIDGTGLARFSRDNLPGVLAVASQTRLMI